MYKKNTELNLKKNDKLSLEKVKLGRFDCLYNDFSSKILEYYVKRIKTLKDAFFEDSDDSVRPPCLVVYGTLPLSFWIGQDQLC